MSKLVEQMTKRRSRLIETVIKGDAKKIKHATSIMDELPEGVWQELPISARAKLPKRLHPTVQSVIQG